MRMTSYGRGFILTMAATLLAMSAIVAILLVDIPAPHTTITKELRHDQVFK